MLASPLLPFTAVVSSGLNLKFLYPRRKVVPLVRTFPTMRAFPLSLSFLRLLPSSTNAYVFVKKKKERGLLKDIF